MIPALKYPRFPVYRISRLEGAAFIEAVACYVPDFSYQYHVAASSRLAPTMPAKTIVYFGCENGQLAAYEDDPRQQVLDFKAGTVSAIGG